MRSLIQPALTDLPHCEGGNAGRGCKRDLSRGVATAGSANFENGPGCYAAGSSGGAAARGGLKNGSSGRSNGCPDLRRDAPCGSCSSSEEEGAGWDKQSVASSNLVCVLCVCVCCACVCVCVCVYMLKGTCHFAILANMIRAASYNSVVTQIKRTHMRAPN